MPSLFLGIDLAWSSNNPTAVALLENDQLIETSFLESDQEIIDYIYAHPDAIVGIDAPLIIPNETGNRDIEKAFLKDFSRFKLGAYPVNRSLFVRLYGEIRGEVIANALTHPIGERLFEVYPHATILTCFNDHKVLPYKQKKGRSVAFLVDQLRIYYGFLSDVIENLPPFLEETLGGIRRKRFEDTLDAITAAYTLYYCTIHPSKCRCYRQTLLTPTPKE